MPLVIYQGDQPVCIDIFPSGTERSCEGSLHLRPRQPKEITNDEYGYLVVSREDVKKRLVKIRD